LKAIWHKNACFWLLEGTFRGQKQGFKDFNGMMPGVHKSGLRQIARGLALWLVS